LGCEESPKEGRDGATTFPVWEKSAQRHTKDDQAINDDQRQSVHKGEYGSR